MNFKYGRNHNNNNILHLLEHFREKKKEQWHNL